MSIITNAEDIVATDDAQAHVAEPAQRLNVAREADENTVAMVAGQPFVDVPTDLYIPPEALEVFLETFEGPLDLLLYLIRRQNLDILQVRVSVITAQYMSYIELMQALQLELAGEYLLMAAMLAEIKSRMLLPRPESLEDEEDPRSELIRRLQEYEQIKSAAENLDEIPRLERDVFPAAANKPDLVKVLAEPDVDLRDVLFALSHVYVVRKCIPSMKLNLSRGRYASAWAIFCLRSASVMGSFLSTSFLSRKRGVWAWWLRS